MQSNQQGMRKRGRRQTHQSSVLVDHSCTGFQFPCEVFVERLVLCHVTYHGFMKFAIEQVPVRVHERFPQPYGNVTIGQESPSPGQDACWKLSQHINLKNEGNIHKITNASCVQCMFFLQVYCFSVQVQYRHLCRIFSRLTDPPSIRILWL